MEELGGLQSIRSQRVGHDWATFHFHMLLSQVTQMGSSNVCAWLTLLHTVGAYGWQSLYPSSQRVWECEQLLFSHSVMSKSVTQWTAAHQAFLSFTISNSCPLSQWCHPTISSSVVPFGSCLQSFPASGSFPMSQLFMSGGQSVRVSASASVLPMNSQDWFPLGLNGWIFLQSKGLSRVFSNNTAKKHQFFSAQISLWSTSPIHPWLLETP